MTENCLAKMLANCENIKTVVPEEWFGKDLKTRRAASVNHQLFQTLEEGDELERINASRYRAREIQLYNKVKELKDFVATVNAAEIFSTEIISSYSIIDKKTNLKYAESISMDSKTSFLDAEQKLIRKPRCSTPTRKNHLILTS